MNANQAKLAITREVTFGVTPTSGVEGATPVLQEIRMTSEDFVRNTTSTRSQELRADRQVADMIQTDVSAGGSVNVEQSFGGTIVSNQTGNITFRPALSLSRTALYSVNSETPKKYARASGSFITDDGFVPGMTVTFAGFADSANNGLKTITAVEALKLTVAETLVTESSPVGAVTAVTTAQIIDRNAGFTAFAAGKWVSAYRAGGLNNGYWYVKSVNATGTSLTVVGPGTTTLAIETAGSTCQVAVNSWADQEWEAAIQGGPWTVPFSESVTGLFSVVGGTDVIGRTAQDDTQTSVFSVNGSGQYERTGGNFNTPFKVGMRVLVAGFAEPENNGLKTITAIPTNTTMEVSDTLVTESSPVGAVSFKSDWVACGYEAGQVVRVEGFATASANKFHIVRSVTTSSLRVWSDLTTESSPGTAVTITVPSQIANGTTQPSFSIERSHTDAPTIFDVFSGQTVNTKSFRVATAAINNGSVGFIGKVDDGNTATVGTGTDEGAPTWEVMNAISNVEEVREDHVAFGTIVRDIAINTNNNLFARTAVSVLGATSIGAGSIEVSGSMTVYYESAALVNRNRNWATTSLTFVFVDADSNYYVVHIPSVKITAAGTPTPGLNGDITLNATWTAFRDATQLETIRVARLQA